MVLCVFDRTIHLAYHQIRRMQLSPPNRQRGVVPHFSEQQDFQNHSACCNCTESGNYTFKIVHKSWLNVQMSCG